MYTVLRRTYSEHRALIHEKFLELHSRLYTILFTTETLEEAKLRLIGDAKGLLSRFYRLGLPRKTKIDVWTSDSDFACSKCVCIRIFDYETFKDFQIEYVIEYVEA